MSRFNTVLQHETDRPSHEGRLARRLLVPILAALAVAVLLVVMQPPFASSGGGSLQTRHLSFVRVLVYAALGGGATALLTHADLFKSKSVAPSA